MTSKKKSLERIKNASQHSKFDVDGDLTIGDEKNNNVNNQHQTTNVNFHLGLNKWLIGLVVTLVLGLLGYRQVYLPFIYRQTPAEVALRGNEKVGKNISDTISNSPESRGESTTDDEKIKEIRNSKKTTSPSLKPQVKEETVEEEKTIHSVSLFFEDNNNQLHTIAGHYIGNSTSKYQISTGPQYKVKESLLRLSCQIDIQEKKINVGLRDVLKVQFSISTKLYDRGQLSDSKYITSEEYTFYDEEDIPKLFSDWLSKKKPLVLPEFLKNNI